MAKLPTVVSNLAPDLRAFVNRVREALDSGGTDRLVTVNDLIRGGIAVPGPGGTVIPPGDGVVGSPPAPINVTATAAIRTIFVEWDAPAYFGHAYAEVWGASTNSLAAAVLLGMSPGSIYVDDTGPSTTRFYWVRFVNTNDTKGPYNATNGVSATTGPEVSYLLDTLSGAITETQLFSSLGSRINLIDGAASLSGSVNARVAAEASARAAAISAEATTRANAISAEATTRANAISVEATTRAQAVLDEASARSNGDDALQTQINLLSAAGSGDFAELLAAVQEEQTARIAGDAAEATSRQTLATQLRGDYTGIDPTALTTGILYNEQQARVSAEGAISSSVSALSSTVTNNFSTLNSAITSEATTRASADTALTNSFSSLSATVGTKNRTFYQSTPPVATAVGDLWFDSDDGNKANRWNGTVWVATDDTRIAGNAAAITSEATARATADSALSTTIGTLTATVNTNNTAVNAAIVTEASTRATADTALSSQITTLSSTVSGNTAAIQTESTTRASADTALSGQITTLTSTVSGNTAAIQTEATTRASADTALSGQITTLSSTVSGNTAAIQTEATTRASADTALSSQITTLTSTVNGNTAAIQTEATTRATADTALSSQITTLTSTVNGNTAAIQTEATTRASADTALSGQITTLSSTVSGNTAAIQSEATTRASADTALSGQITTLASTVSGNTAAIQTEATTRASADTALSGQITTLSSTVSGNTTAIQTEASTRATQTGELYAKYTVKIDTNGYVSGFGLASTANNSTPFSEFIIRADRFSIANPSGPGITPIVPFVVNTTTQTVNGVTVPAGVYMDAAFVKNGTITNAKIGNAAIDDAKITNLSVGKLTAGSISVGSYIESSNYLIGSQGWKIHGDGTAEFAAASIRGQLTATQIDARGLSILDASGNVILNAGTGNFTGDVSGTVAGTAASTVVSTANDAAAAASTAQGTANTAVSAASTAQSTANSAASAASTAQSTANSAASAASTAQSTADAAIDALGTKLDNDARNVLSGSGGIALGSLNWDSNGDRTSGYGVGLTRAGFAAFNSSGTPTFTLSASTGDATFTGTVNATSGSFTGAVYASSGSFTGAVYASSGSFSGAVTASSLTADSMNVAKRDIIEQASVTVSLAIVYGSYVSSEKGGGTIFYPAGTVFTAAINKLIRTNITDSFFSTSSILRQPFGCSVYATGTGTYVGGDGVFNVKVDAEVIVNRRYSAGGSSTVDENQVFIYLRQFVVTNVSSTFTRFDLPTTLYWKLSRA